MTLGKYKLTYYVIAKSSNTISFSNQHIIIKSWAWTNEEIHESMMTRGTKLGNKWIYDDNSLMNQWWHSPHE